MRSSAYILDSELIALTNFSDNRPVDVLKILHSNFGAEI